MDYIGKIKTIASGAVIAMVACTAITLTSSDKAVTSAQNVTTVTEETSSDDGSAPGPYLSNVEVNTSFVQSAVMIFEIKYWIIIEALCILALAVINFKFLWGFVEKILSSIFRRKKNV